LAGSSGINFDDSSASLFRFADEHLDERTPSHIMNRLGEHPHRQALNIQILHRNQTEVIDNLPAQLVVKVQSLVSDMSMSLLEKDDSLTSSLAPLLPTGYPTLSHAQPLLSLPVVAGVLDYRSIRENGEAFQPDINADALLRVRQQAGIELDAEADVPLTRLTLDRHGLDDPDQGTMPFDLEVPSPLKLELAVIQDLATISIAGKGDTVEAAVRLEAREARCLAVFDSRKERIKRFRQTAQDLLTARKVRQCQITIRSNLLELVSLILVADRFAHHPVSIPSLLKRSIVQLAGFSQLAVQKGGLDFGRVQAVAKGFSHESILTKERRRQGGKLQTPRLHGNSPAS